MTPMMLTYRAAEIPAEQESNHATHHHHYADDITTRPKPAFGIEKVSEDSAQLSSLGRGDCRKFQLAFAEHLHSEAVDCEAAHGEGRPQRYMERNQWQATSKPSMQMR
jgi:hypothetical protein